MTNFKNFSNEQLETKRKDLNEKIDRALFEMKLNEDLPKWYDELEDVIQEIKFRSKQK